MANLRDVHYKGHITKVFEPIRIFTSFPELTLPTLQKRNISLEYCTDLSCRFLCHVMRVLILKGHSFLCLRLSCYGCRIACWAAGQQNWCLCVQRLQILLRTRDIVDSDLSQFRIPAFLSHISRVSPGTSKTIPVWCLNLRKAHLISKFCNSYNAAIRCSADHRGIVMTFHHSRVADLGAPYGRECIEGYNTLKTSSSCAGIEM